MQPRDGRHRRDSLIVRPLGARCNMKEPETFAAGGIRGIEIVTLKTGVSPTTVVEMKTTEQIPSQTGQFVERILSQSWRFLYENSTRRWRVRVECLANRHPCSFPYKEKPLLRVARAAVLVTSTQTENARLG